MASPDKQLANPVSTSEQRRVLEGLDRAALAAHQLQRLNKLLAAILPENQFYAHKLACCPQQLESLEQLTDLPRTTKAELVGEGTSHTLPANLTWPLTAYSRYHQTSGTQGRPLSVYDTASDWQWWLDCWHYVMDAADVGPEDRALLAFSFGPHIGFWSAHDVLVARGTLIVPAGGMDTLARLDLLERTQATVLFCTPTYALHLAEVAAKHSINLAHTAVCKVVVAGEPGGSIPATRGRIEEAWEARVTDHCGATEVGPWGYGDAAGVGLHVLESEFLAEFLSVETGQPAAEGELAELVLTSLGRVGMPVLRYRTGDLVRPSWAGTGTSRFVHLPGGVLGRADDMLIVRGVNIFPSSLEQILRSFPEVVEYRISVRKAGALDELVVEVEDRLQEPARIAAEMQLRLGLKVDVRLAPAMSLPRFEGKGERWIDLRKAK